MKHGISWLLLSILTVSCLLFGSSIGQAAPFGSSLDNTATLLVLSMKNKTGYADMGPYIGSAEENFLFELQDADVFAHIHGERDCRKVLDEQAFQQTGLTSTAVATMADSVKARYVLYSSLTGLSVKRSAGRLDVSTGSGYQDTAHGKTEKVKAMISVKVVDRQTGDTIFQGHGEGVSREFKLKEGMLQVRVGTEAATEEACNNAIMKAVENGIEGDSGLRQTLLGKG